MLSRRLLLLVACIGFAAMTGCASLPTGKLQALKNSTQAVHQNTLDTYARIERLQRRFVVTTLPDMPLTRDGFTPKIEGQSFDLVPALRLRESAIEVLARYANLLFALATKDYASDIDAASQEMAGSLQNLRKTAGSAASDAESKGLNAIAAVVDSIGRVLVDYKRREALRRAMDLAQDDLEKLAALIARSNDRIRLAERIMADRILAHANAARPAYGSRDRMIFDSDVAEFLAESEGIESSLDATSAAVAKLPSAHHEIRQVLDERATNLDALQSFVREAQRAGKFYRGL